MTTCDVGHTLLLDEAEIVGRLPHPHSGTTRGARANALLSLMACSIAVRDFLLPSVIPFFWGGLGISFYRRS